MASAGKILRRTFLIGSAAIVGGVAFGAWIVARPAPNPLQPGEGEAALNPFVFIDATGVTLIAPRAEMGQGVHTTWAALIAEELDMGLDQVRVLHGPAAQAYYNSAMIGDALPSRGYDVSDFQHNLGQMLGVMGKVVSLQVTGGSTSMKDGFVRMREAGASARETLKEAAARRLGVARDTLRTDRGDVIAPDGTKIAYSDLAPDAARIEPTETPLRDPSEWKLLGRTQPRVDMVAKATGTAEFGVDVRLPGMTFASLRMNPHLGGAMTGFDATAAEAMAGVQKVIDLGTGIAVVASNTWLAMKAAEAVQIDWAEARRGRIVCRVPWHFPTPPVSGKAGRMTCRHPADPAFRVTVCAHCGDTARAPRRQFAPRQSHTLAAKSDTLPRRGDSFSGLGDTPARTVTLLAPTVTLRAILPLECVPAVPSSAIDRALAVALAKGASALTTAKPAPISAGKGDMTHG